MPATRFAKTFAELLLILTLNGLLSACTSVFFQPMQLLVRSPADIQLAYQDIYFTSRDGTPLHGWFLPATGSAQGTVLLLHGNAENISTHIGSIYWLPPRGFNVFLFDYRGYGRSGGDTGINGALQDIQSALQWLLKNPDIDPSRIAVLGQSLGGALGAHALTRPDLSKAIRVLILDSAFSSYRQIVREKLAGFWLTWPLQYPLSWFIPNRYDPIDVIAGFSPTPVLIIHNEHDNVILVAHARRLFQRAQHPKHLWIIPRDGHISALQSPEIRDRLVDYLLTAMDPKRMDPQK
jgi:fermentation-respiration switch protein FrsA (DUF1100 family)